MQLTIPRLGSGVNPIPKANGLFVGKASGKAKIMSANVSISQRAVTKTVNTGQNELRQAAITPGSRISIKI